MSRALLALPGRGAYTPAALGSLAGEPLLDAVDERRAQHDLPPLAALDAAARFSPSEHLRPANVAPLIYLNGLRDAHRLRDGHDIVAVVGNGLGWCTALAVAGAVDATDGLRIVQEIAIAQEAPLAHGGPGGQLLYPLADGDWRPMPARIGQLERAIAGAHGEAWLSIELGPYAVLAGSEAGLDALNAALPPLSVAGRAYPLRLGLHGPDHTPLAAQVADAARKRLAEVAFCSPESTLVDGRGMRHAPWSSDPAELAAYTLGEHLTATYRFATSVRVALRELAPDVVLLPGPGATLGGIIGGIIVAEGYRGIRDRTAFAAAQAGERPLVVTV